MTWSAAASHFYGRRENSREDQLVWDSQVHSLDSPIGLVPADVAPGQLYWRLVRMDWLKPGESGSGNCLIVLEFQLARK